MLGAIATFWQGGGDFLCEGEECPKSVLEMHLQFCDPPVTRNVCANFMNLPPLPSPPPPLNMLHGFATPLCILWSHTCDKTDHVHTYSSKHCYNKQKNYLLDQNGST